MVQRCHGSSELREDSKLGSVDLQEAETSEAGSRTPRFLGIFHEVSEQLPNHFRSNSEQSWLGIADQGPFPNSRDCCLFC